MRQFYNRLSFTSPLSIHFSYRCDVMIGLTLICGAFLGRTTFYHFSNRQFSLFLSPFSSRMKIHKNGNASEVLKSISISDNSNKQC